MKYFLLTLALLGAAFAAPVPNDEFFDAECEDVPEPTTPYVQVETPAPITGEADCESEDNGNSEEFENYDNELKFDDEILDDIINDEYAHTGDDEVIETLDDECEEEEVVEKEIDIPVVPVTEAPEEEEAYEYDTTYEEEDYEEYESTAAPEPEPEQGGECDDEEGGDIPYVDNNNVLPEEIPIDILAIGEKALFEETEYISSDEIEGEECEEYEEEMEPGHLFPDAIIDVPVDEVEEECEEY